MLWSANITCMCTRMILSTTATWIARSQPALAAKSGGLHPDGQSACTATSGGASLTNKVSTALKRAMAECSNVRSMHRPNPAMHTRFFFPFLL